jgi:hypothetical protein
LQELESTRETLRTAATDLPKETAQQAASMRRAVADQIKALEELGDIVTRSGRSLDVSAPAQPSPSYAPPAVTARPAPASPRRAEPPRPAAKPPRAQAAAQPEPRRQAIPPRPTAPQPSASGGWLSDLLARASTDEPPETTSDPSGSAAKRATPGLDSLSLDVARMIDPVAAADAWERYRLGEANAFSRRIYIGRGPQTFDEVRRRYRLDPDFHSTVDRYVQEFERLLAEAGRNDPNQSVARTYLASETGKVYTMLAHAAGRLG